MLHKPQFLLFCDIFLWTHARIHKKCFLQIYCIIWPFGILFVPFFLTFVHATCFLDFCYGLKFQLCLSILQSLAMPSKSYYSKFPPIIFFLHFSWCRVSCSLKGSPITLQREKLTSAGLLPSEMFAIEVLIGVLISSCLFRYALLFSWLSFCSTCFDEKSQFGVGINSLALRTKIM